jgi:hypothetical protein
MLERFCPSRDRDRQIFLGTLDRQYVYQPTPKSGAADLWHHDKIRVACNGRSRMVNHSGQTHLKIFRKQCVMMAKIEDHMI